MNVMPTQVKHHYEDHFHKVVEWCAFSPELLQKIKDSECLVEAAAMNNIPDGKPIPSSLVVWCCAHCRDLPSEQPPMEQGQIKKHIRTM